ncbi:hypothetical protein GCM10007977_005850 [Dactylosporangium sucinum]|uniref:Uncharacterized protein n=1 Tax=Dactylosporangium sucinum TaxID=1424081 RepID=A0A917T3E2_9ACTN|nr:hypothetical protein GCM10007977_005850 [Dactylosporangium sucinum]
MARAGMTERGADGGPEQQDQDQGEDADDPAAPVRLLECVQLVPSPPGSAHGHHDKAEREVECREFARIRKSRSP